MQAPLQQRTRSGARLPAPLRAGEGSAAARATSSSRGGVHAAISQAAARANAGPHAAQLAAMRSVIMQRGAGPGAHDASVAQRVIRIEDQKKSYKKADEIRAAAYKAHATKSQAEALVTLGGEVATYKFDNWKHAVDTRPLGDEGSDSGSESGFDEEFDVYTTNRLVNLENKIRNWATRAGEKDNSGHGKGRHKPNKGHSGDRHQHGQERKVQDKADKVDSLESALKAYRDTGGTAKMLDPSTVKLLGDSGVSWRKCLEHNGNDSD